MKFKKQARQYKKEAKDYARMQKRRARNIQGHPFVVPVLTFLFLFFVSMIAFIGLNAQTIGAGDAHVVQFSIDGEKQVLPTRASTVGKLLNRLEIKVGKHDVIEPPLDTPILEDNFKINLYRAKPVIVVEGKKEVSMLTAITSPKNVVTKAGFKLFPEDRVVLASADDVLNEGVIGHKIIIEHATPVKLNLFGRMLSLRTHSKTARELLKERGVDVSGVNVFPSISANLKKNSVVFVTKPGIVVKFQEVSLPFGQSFVDDYSLPYGVTKVRSAGENGKKVIVFSAPKKHPEQKHKLQEVLVSRPVNAVIARGRRINTSSVSGDRAALMAAAGISSGDYYAVDFIISHESGWRPGALSGSGCAGLGQACPGSKVISACPNWSNNAVCQLRFFSGYAQRYGGWQQAYFVWQNQGWW